MKESDFEIQWFSGTGKGGQHRNKHQNCCRAIHKETGITAIGTASRSRESNRKAALAVCRARVVQALQSDPERFAAGFERVRTYHEPDNLVRDHASGETDTYKNVVEKCDLEALIDARRKAKLLI
jgi:protein subunit release factor A